MAAEIKRERFWALNEETKSPLKDKNHGSRCEKI